MEPLSLPLSFLFVIEIAHASAERSRKPMPICPRKRRNMNPIKNVSGLMIGMRRRVKDASNPP